MNFQLVIDCADPEPLVRFWAQALDYRVPDPPQGHATWRDYYLSIGVPAHELGEGDCADRLVHLNGAGPDMWLQIVPETRPSKTGFTSICESAADGRCHWPRAASGSTPRWPG